MDIKIERVFDAPVERVWAMWTEPENVAKWWGPKDFKGSVSEMDFRVGGKFVYCMRGAMGPGQPEQNFYSGGEFIEIVPTQKLVVTDYFTDTEGNKINAKEVGMPGEWPDEMRVTVTFEDMGGKTKLSLLHEGHPAEMADMAQAGWNQSLDKFAAAL